jgi:Sulfatase-modifying factor enzyme 1
MSRGPRAARTRGNPPPRDRARPRASGATALLLLLMPLAPGIVAADQQLDEIEARRIGPAALPGILAQVASADPDIRMRARVLARRIALDYYAARAPEGMRVIPGTIVVTPTGVRSEGGFYLGTHEVTLGEFREFAHRRKLADRWAAGAADLPATNVSLEEARAFAGERDARLPTLEEFTRATRGGGRLRYPWGQRFDPARVNSREAGRAAPAPVGSCPRGLSVHGIADLLGNVAEWTETAADRRRFVATGGSYRWYAEQAPPPYKLEPSSRLPDVGFRLAKSLPPLGP